MLKAANAAAAADPAKRGMGCTLTALLLRADERCCASRAEHDDERYSGCVIFSITRSDWRSRRSNVNTRSTRAAL